MVCETFVSGVIIDRYVSIGSRVSRYTIILSPIFKHSRSTNADAH